MVLKANVKLKVKKSLSQNWRDINLFEETLLISNWTWIKVYVNPGLAELSFEQLGPVS